MATTARSALLPPAWSSTLARPGFERIHTASRSLPGRIQSHAHRYQAGLKCAEPACPGRRATPAPPASTMAVDQAGEGSMAVPAASAKDQVQTATTGLVNLRENSRWAGGSHMYDGGEQLVTGWHFHDVHEIEYACRG